MVAPGWEWPGSGVTVADCRVWAGACGFTMAAAGTPVLVLLHGLAATGDVWNGWRPLLAQRWPGRWLAPDLPGHGGSLPLSKYTFGSLANAVADLVGPDARTVVLGHSLGGAVGLALASDRFAATGAGGHRPGDQGRLGR